MSISSSSRSRRGSSVGILSVMLLMVALMAIVRPLLAQTVVDREDPLSTDTVLLRPYYSEQFGHGVHALGDINGDHIADFGITRFRYDTMFLDFGVKSYPGDLLIYQGVKGSIPSASSGQRVGPKEIGTITTFLAAGDWDSDGNRDIAVSIHQFGDSSFDNTEGYSLGHVVIFWGDSGRYSLQDTTRLSCGSQVWLGIRAATSGDLNGDRADDLCLWCDGGGFSSGSIVRIPSLLIFRGHHGQRWGANGVGRLPDWGYWSPPPFNILKSLDQDCDGKADVVLEGSTGVVSILYGQPEALPDTTQIQRVALDSVLGSYSLLTDLTGDHVPELVVKCADERVRIFAGNAGQRLFNLFGTGNDPADPDHGRPYSRPWVTLDMPHRLHDGWAPIGGNPIYDFGDMNLDGYRDVWTFSDPFLICYGSGKHLDSKIDAMFDTRNIDGFSGLTWLGDVDGSGFESFAVSSTSGTIQFVKLDRQWEIGSDVAHPFPHPEGFVCLHDASAVGTHHDTPRSLDLSVLPSEYSITPTELPCR